MSQRTVQSTQRAGRLKRKQVDVLASREKFVKEVQKNKTLLFDAFSPTVTDAAKMEKWEEIRVKMVEEEGDELLRDKTAEYVKKTYWQRIRGDALERFDKARTGSEPKEKYKAVIQVLVVES